MRDGRGRVLPGSKLSPGRPKGARSRLGEKFSKAMLADFKNGGVEAIERFRRDDPAGYCRAIVSMMPRDVNIDADGLKLVEVSFIGFEEDALDGDLIEDAELVEDESLSLPLNEHSFIVDSNE